MPDAPLFSLVILSFRRFATTTGPCLASLLAQAPPADVELILVDNGSDDGAAQACMAAAQEHPRLHYLPLERNLGFAGGMNAGVVQAHGHWVCLVNSDTVFPAGALERLHETLTRVDPRVGLIGPVTNAAGNGQCLPLPGCDLATIVDIGARAMRQPTGLLLPTYRCDFFCVAIRRGVWQQLGGLDEIFGLGYYEDFDFSLRARQAGHEMRIAEDVFIVHAGSITFKAMGDAQKELMRRNKALMRQRHPDARFEHQRLGNAQALEALLQEVAIRGWTSGGRARAAWRYAELLRNEPRSPVKRWWWRRRHAALRARLDAAGIVPALPQPAASGTT